MSLICSIAKPTVEEIFLEIEKGDFYSDLFEVRLDALQKISFSEIASLMKEVRKPLLFTFRRREDGGFFEILEKSRFEILEEMASLHPAYLDLEADLPLEWIEKITRRSMSTDFIGSYHNFSKTPIDLRALLKSMENPRFYAYKIAVTAKSSLDFLRLMVFLKEASPQKKLSCISMGKFGRPSRAIGPVLGNFLNYSSVEAEREKLHRIDLKTLHELFRYPKLNQKTKLYALLGDPVEQSLGDLFHNEVFEKERVNALYVKIQIAKKELQEALSWIKKLPFFGLSITMPLKESIVPLLDKVDEEASLIGAVNTVQIERERFLGSNTDGIGALNAVEKHFLVRGKALALLGAGGASQAIAFEAIKRGALIKIFNRSISKREVVAKKLGCESFPLSDLKESSFDLLINTLPLKAFEEGFFVGKALPKIGVMDINYMPKETPFFKEMEGRGLLFIYGEEMFFEQARLQQLAWKRVFSQETSKTMR